MAKGEKKVRKSHGGIYEVVKALIVAIVVTLASVLIFALIVKWCSVSDGVIAPVNQAIKAVALLIGCIAAFRSGVGGWRKGLIVGILYVALSFVIFSLLDGKFVFDLSLLYDVLLGTAMGLICGVIAVNVRKPKLSSENA